MGQTEVLEILKANKGRWVDVKKMVEILQISPSTIRRSANQLVAFKEAEVRRVGRVGITLEYKYKEKPQ